MLGELLQVWAKHMVYVRNLINDVVAIRSARACHQHIWIVDAYLEPLAMEFLDNPQHRAFAQIIGSGFEAQAKHSDFGIASGFDLLKGALNLPLVRV